MRTVRRGRGGRSTARARTRPAGPAAPLAAALLAAALAAALAAGCDDAPFEPFAENTVGPFAIFGYLDLRADTQWVRVMPIRQNLLTAPDPIDAIVTLEHLGTGRVVTLRDSLFGFTDRELGGVGYAHNFWTTEPVEPEATYRLVATRSDGAATTAMVEMPPDSELSLRFWQHSEKPQEWYPLRAFVEGENLLYAEVLFTVWNSTGDGWPEPPVQLRMTPHPRSWPGNWEIGLPGWWFELNRPSLEDTERWEAQIVMGGADWPFEPGLSPTDAAVPGNIPTTVEDGVGFLLGVERWRIPLAICEPMESRPDGRETCMTIFDSASTSIVGRVSRDPCGERSQLVSVRLTERYPGGGVVVWWWKTDWSGAYRFEGLEPGSELTLEFGGYPTPIPIPPLAPGERYQAPFIAMPSSC
jgi:hypothetical protein